MAMAQFLVQKHSLRTKGITTMKGRCVWNILIYNNQEKQHTIVDEERRATWNEIEQMTGELKKQTRQPK